MSDLNLWQGIGRLGKDPEVRAMPNGDAVASFSVATSERWTDKQTGERKEVTEWTRCVAFRKLAEVCGQYLSRGKQVYVSGKKRTRQYDKDGQTHSITEIVLDQMQMLGAKDDQPRQAQQAPTQTQYRSNRPPVQDCPQADQGTTDAFEDDDIPF